MYLCMCSFTACSRVSSAEHRGHESHAEPGESPRDPGHHERAVKGDDEGQQQHPENKDAIFIELNLNKFNVVIKKFILPLSLYFYFRLALLRKCWKTHLRAWKIKMTWRKQQRQKLTRFSMRSQQVIL